MIFQNILCPIFHFLSKGKPRRRSVNSGQVARPLTTPMALRAISSKAQAELASLYADENEEEEEDEEDFAIRHYGIEDDDEQEVTFKAGKRLSFHEDEDEEEK